MPVVDASGGTVCTAHLAPVAHSTTTATGSCSATSATSVAGGSTTVTAHYGGDSTYAASASGPAALTVSPAASHTTVAARSNPIGAGSVAYTATVTGTHDGLAPAGTVTVGDGTSSCTATLSSAGGDVATGTCSLAETAAGSPYTVTARYGGDADYAGSSGSVTEAVVAPATPTVTVTPSASPATTGSVTYTVDVAGPTGAPVPITPAGSVVTVSDGTSSCTTTLDHGRGSCSLVETAAGSPYTVTASYPGDANFGPATGSVSETVGRATPILAPNATTFHVVYGDESAVTFSATVSAPHGGPVPTGTVTVNDPLCTITLTNGAGTCSPSNTALLPGNYPVSMTYNGNANYLPVTSTTARLHVHALGPNRTLLSLSPTTVGYGGEGGVTATVLVGRRAGIATPSGTADVGTLIGGKPTLLCTATITNGTGSCALSSSAATSLSVGVHPIGAVFAGRHPGHPSNVVPLTVTTATPTVTVRGTPDPATVGTGGTAAVTYHVSVVGAGGSTPAGTVTVSDGAGRTCTTAALDAAGAGSCTIDEPAGTFTVTATYVPPVPPATAGPYLTTTGTTTETVVAAPVVFPVPGTTTVVTTGTTTPAPSTAPAGSTGSYLPTTTTLALSTPGVDFGAEQVETFTVDVSAASGVPSGMVQVMSGSGLPLCQLTLSGGTGSCSPGTAAGGAVVCTATLSGGAGTCSLGDTELVPGTYTLDAVYPGSPDPFAGSTSNAVALTVLPAPTAAAGGTTSTGTTSTTAVTTTGTVPTSGTVVSAGTVPTISTFTGVVPTTAAAGSSVVPIGAVNTGGGSTAGEQDVALLAAGGLLCIAGLATVAVGRRRRRSVLH